MHACERLAPFECVLAFVSTDPDYLSKQYHAGLSEYEVPGAHLVDLGVGR